MLTIICNKFIQSVYDSLFDVGVGGGGYFQKMSRSLWATSLTDAAVSKCNRY